MQTRDKVKKGRKGEGKIPTDPHSGASISFGFCWSRNPINNLIILRHSYQSFSSSSTISVSDSLRVTAMEVSKGSWQKERKMDAPDRSITGQSKRNRARQGRAYDWATIICFVSVKSFIRITERCCRKVETFLWASFNAKKNFCSFGTKKCPGSKTNF